MTISSMGPFSQVSPTLHRLSQHPDPIEFKSIILNSSFRDRETLVRLWLTEGIPFAFRNSAGIYDEMREWIASRLEISAKDITLVGSGRIGFSMRPNQFGRAFGSNSDLDLTVVSAKIFDKCRIDAEKFVADLKGGEITPKNEKQKIYWRDNADRFPQLIYSGFVDANMVPNISRYKEICSVNDTMWRLSERLRKTSLAPQPLKVSVRVYRSWEDLVKRVSLNLHGARRFFQN